MSEALVVNSIRCLGAALPTLANSGHPGAPMGCAPMAHCLFGREMRFDPSDVEWMNRDRFVLSNGHGCALLYTILHLSHNQLSLDDLRSFRKIGSKCPGHPENFATPGVEVTTGPLGQGISMAVGLAAAQKHMAATFNKPAFPIFDSRVYAIVGDGCLQEGVASEASSLAGTWKLNNLCVLYDANGIQIDGSTELAFTEDVAMRYEAYGWNVLHVEVGDTDLDAISKAIQASKTVDKPTIVIVRTTIGFGCGKQGTAAVHGSPLKMDDILAYRKQFGLESDDILQVPSTVYDFYAGVKQKNSEIRQEWDTLFAKYSAAFPSEASEILRRFKGDLPCDFVKSLPVYTSEDKVDATRNLSGKVLNAVAAVMPEIVGGSADLTKSNMTELCHTADFSTENFGGKYIRFGVREHGMMAVANGMLAFGGVRPFGATFLNFITYAWGAIRLAALSRWPVLCIASHDSIELGEDGPTHQPVEVLPLLRATPNLYCMRPADGNEVSGMYAVWAESKTTPVVACLSRGAVDHIPNSSIENTRKGAYVACDWDVHAEKKVLVGASGTEVTIAVKAKKVLEAEGYSVRVVSMPCWQLFLEQSKQYQESVIPSSGCLKKAYVEASSGFGVDMFYDRDASTVMPAFGASASKNVLWEHFGYTPEKVAAKIKASL
ncbi:MAG: hypothetical protein KVP17_003537 [Porospora cf. gigantea B]|uniref:uncharacterized protein n=1 Tax=Porospora cf. gigantea B TaxID=2853592 RepID=UPI003571BB6F|nr:MAG: hypothetical protein KVP17_003537 [Porospora cf. gigantea B]